VKVLVLGGSGSPWLLMIQRSFLIPNRLMTPCHILHKKMLSKQLKLSKNKNTYLETTLNGSGLISPLNNFWKNG